MTATLAYPAIPVDTVDIPLHSLTTRQVAAVTLVPMPKIYQLKKHLESGLHFIETRSNINNAKLIGWLAPGLTQVELLHWLSIGRKSGWSHPRLEAFRLTSEWLEVNYHV